MVIGRVGVRGAVAVVMFAQSPPQRTRRFIDATLLQLASMKRLRSELGMKQRGEET